jgi:glutamate N-acetyltransferase/amino-acid acetyltransferase
MNTLEPNTDLDAIHELPAGFQLGGLHCGIKRSRRDLGVILCPGGATVAGCVTQNPVRATCVERTATLLPASEITAVVINSGNANAMTGETGVRANLQMASVFAEGLGCSPDRVLTCSTGVIGVPLDTAPIASAAPDLIAKASATPEGIADFAHAILTTDTITKVAELVVSIPGLGAPIRLLGVAKGSGMVHPNMATTLGYVCTDASIGASDLQTALSSAIESTFNAISVDGDTSTNDCVLVLASGHNQGEIAEATQLEAFTQALETILRALAIQVAQDGEGATRLLEVEVRGASSKLQAKAVARGIAKGALFKCSVFAGEVSGWGRLIAAAGQAALEMGAEIVAENVAISAQGVQLVSGGTPIPGVDVPELTRRLRDAKVHWTLDLGAGEHEFTAYGCDLSYDYVRINADESLQVEVTAQGQVGRNLSLASYSPSLKHQLLVDGLGYVRRFTGLRVLVHLSGAAARKPALLSAVARDLELMLDAGMRPVVATHAQSTIDQLRTLLGAGAYALTEIAPEPVRVAACLDRGLPCALLQKRPDPGALVDLAVRVGVGKLLSLADDQGLHDDSGLVSELSPDQALTGLDRGRFETVADENLAFARHAARQGLPALHLIDGRIPHALVAELFTNRGVGTLVTRLY